LPERPSPCPPNVEAKVHTRGELGHRVFEQGERALWRYGVETRTRVESCGKPVCRSAGWGGWLAWSGRGFGGT